jgi:hypothetical protein
MYGPADCHGVECTRYVEAFYTRMEKSNSRKFFSVLFTRFFNHRLVFVERDDLGDQRGESTGDIAIPARDIKKPVGLVQPNLLCAFLKKRRHVRVSVPVVSRHPRKIRHQGCLSNSTLQLLAIKAAPG